MSMPEESFSVQRRSPTLMAATICLVKLSKGLSVSNRSAAFLPAPSPTTSGRSGIGFAHGRRDHRAFGIDHIGLAARLPHGEGNALLDHDLERRGQKPHDLRVLHPRHLLEPLLGGVGVEGEHQGARTGAKRLGQLGVGGVLLAFDGDALDAKAGGDGEGLERRACVWP